MGIDAIFSRENWVAVPFHFWSLVLFTFGSIVGSFLNVCIYRMPLGLSVVSPPSHCPHCKYSIPWYLNIPLVTWLWLRGRCAKCDAPISPRYFLVELLTGLLFLACWLVRGPNSAWVALIYCLFVAGLIVATFIDFEHYIIPDEITLGGIVVGVLATFAVPQLHDLNVRAPALLRSFAGVAVGWLLLFAIVRGGKLLFGRQKIALAGAQTLVFAESELHLPDRALPYEEIFYRKSDFIVVEASRVELIDRCYLTTKVRLSPERLFIGGESFDPETVPHMEVRADSLVLPREAMGFGDVKFMAAIGAFLGWQATVFSLVISSFIGSIVGVTMIVCGRRTTLLPYGPYIAIAALIWVLGGKEIGLPWFNEVFGVWLGSR